MSHIIPFDFDARQVRIVQDDDGEPLFVAKDVAEALGYVWKGEEMNAKNANDANGRNMRIYHSEAEARA